MCGIVGYVGKSNATEIILGGLEQLEYRGYDSAGIALYTEDGIKIAKEKGRLKNLNDELEVSPLNGLMGIGHTRWATHGAPSKTNAHPHTTEEKTIAVVHNGIIENYRKLQEMLVKEGYTFVTETDTEVVPYLVDWCYEGDLLAAVYKAISYLEGAYALGIMHKNHPNELVAVRKESPLIVGIAEDGYLIASDIPAVLEHTQKVYYVDNHEVVYLTPDDVKFFDGAKAPVQKDVKVIDWDAQTASKGGYDYFMLKEIHEQPVAIGETLKRRLDENGRIHLDDFKLTKEQLENISKVYIVACGTAYYAGIVGKYIIEKLAKIPVITDIASEFRYSDPFIDENTLMIVVSQSGETADTLAAMKEAQSKGARVLAITNVVGSSLARGADDIFYTWAGPEIAVASTKAYTSQIVGFYTIALYFADLKGIVTPERYNELIEKILPLGDKVAEILENKGQIEEIAKKLVNAHSAFYLGRGLDYTIAEEGALKLKEVAYVHTEAFAAGELKHGTIALIEDDVPVIAISTQEELIGKLVSNIKEVKARGAYVVAIAKKGCEEMHHVADEVIEIPVEEDFLMPILAVVPTQLIAYYTSITKGIDVDKPRNLAKSVTVE
ncbi:MAG: glutamine--fructose-6-phosphate aminotransferase [Epulopiscium sp. Nele67-Bin005]|nr:MAG: glutamine--fructose-6-phosphate aminotransferase [Epulopiscium sp. Nele67-Bin005]